MTARKKLISANQPAATITGQDQWRSSVIIYVLLLYDLSMTSQCEIIQCYFVAVFFLKL